MGKHPFKKATMSSESEDSIPTTATSDATTSEAFSTDTRVDETPPHGQTPVVDPASLSDADLASMLKALRAELRAREAAKEASRPKVGSQVRILKGGPKYLGKVGTAVIVRKSRCFVSVPGISAPAYVLIDDLELVT